MEPVSAQGGRVPRRVVAIHADWSDVRCLELGDEPVGVADQHDRGRLGADVRTGGSQDVGGCDGLDTGAIPIELRRRAARG